MTSQTLPALLDPATADLLAKVCGMFGSDHAGERAAAAARAHALVREHGLSWPQLFEPASARAQRATSVDPHWTYMARACWARSASLRPRGTELVRNLIQQGREPTARQLEWLRDIHRRLAATAGDGR
jgi:hypothetical protein